MNLKPAKLFSRLFVLFVICVISESAPGAETPSAKLALSFKPIHKDLEYETPSPKEYDKCRVKVERTKVGSGWIVIGPNGQLLRRFVDTNGDNVVDQWRYFNHGIEIYRDIDSNFNNRVDQSRWLNTGGTRWSIDKNEDGRTDSWKMISAEEASRVAIQAIAGGDAAALKILLINQDDTKTLGINKELSARLLNAVSSPESKIKTIRSSSTLLNENTRWVRFDGSTPGMIPADDGKATNDLMVYENTMAIVETGGKTGLVQIGELVRVGSIWKLTQIPQPIEGDSIQVTLGGLLMQPALVAATTSEPLISAGNITPEMQNLLEQLQKLDVRGPSSASNVSALAKFNSERAGILERIVALAKTDSDREQWTRQLVDGVAAAVQTGAYPDGLKKLQSIEQQLKRDSSKSTLVGYVSYRRLLAEYATKLQTATSNDKRQKVQEWWLSELERFTKQYSGTDDVAEAMLQLAISKEFSGKVTDARKWYGKLVADHSLTHAGLRATGAVRRLDLKGKSFSFSAPGLNGGTIDAATYRGKTLLVLFWATWCKPCTEDLPQIRALYEQYHDRGFEILGVNLDVTSDPVAEYLKQHRMTWPQAHQEGGLESNPAQAFGIITLPTMFLVGSDGKVVSRSVSVDDLKTMLPVQIKKRSRVGGL